MSDIQVISTGEGNVRIGDIGIASGTGALRTLLGSCLGLILFDRHRRVGSLAHIVLPHSQGRTDKLGKYVDTAIPEMIRMLNAAGGRTGALQAKMTGGADMFATSKLTTVGCQNLGAARETLKFYGIPVLGEHCGGAQGRRVTFYVADCRVRIEVVGESPAMI